MTSITTTVLTPTETGSPATSSNGQPASDPPPGRSPAGGATAPGPNVGDAAAAGSAWPRLSAGYLSEKLCEAELLLGYAAESGIDVNDKVRDAVLNARVAMDGGGLTEPAAVALLTALTKLAASLRPVTPASLASLKANPEEARAVLRTHFWYAVAFAVPIVVLSLLTFVSGHVADKIKTDVDNANGLAIKLGTELGPAVTNLPDIGGETLTSSAVTLTPDQQWWGADEPPRGLSDQEVISNLQAFAATMREIDFYTRQLNFFVWPRITPPYEEPSTTNRQLQLTPGLPGRFSTEFARKVPWYQNVRLFGDSVTERQAICYGAIAAWILPILYALLGAEAYLLRLYEDQRKNCTFVSGDGHGARYLMSGIGGMVVGLFNLTNLTASTTMGPFAVAFLVGYAVDLFFTFLEGLLQIFRRNPGEHCSARDSVKMV
jgi:hypothetical protein